MNKIYEEINKLSGGRYADVRFSSVRFSGDTAVITVVADEKRAAMLKADHTELASLAEKVCAFHSKVSIEITVADRSARYLRDRTAEFTRSFPFVASIADSVTAPTPTSVKLVMFKSMYNLAKTDFLPRLDEFLENNFLDKITVTVEQIEYEQSKSEEQSQPAEKVYDTTDLTQIVGDLDCGKALSAASVNGNNDDIRVCGVITMTTELTSKGGGAKRSRPYEKFLLYDGETTLQCRYFPHDGVSLFGAGVRNRKVTVAGNTAVERGRTGETSMTVRDVAYCEAQGLEVFPSVPEPSEYVTVVPAPYEEYVQATLFGGDDVLPQSLKGTFVAFDFETTGLSILYDRPTELGAVKIVDGVITETFHTMIDPLRPIPEEVQKKTGITDDMVKGQPRFKDVLPDFYKFTYGAALVGHNIAFDFPFLIKYGNKYGWAFGDRVTYDTLGIAPKALPGIEVLTLDSVLTKLGLVNDNAHRALSDATATAKAFITMSKLLDKNK